MSTDRLAGIATAITSIAHGGDSSGTTQSLRRERVVQPDGSVEDVPIISGNALRGILRDHMAMSLWRLIGEPQLSLPAFHTLWSGGTLAKAGAGNVWLIRDVQTLHRLIPHLALFGCAANGRIISGKLLVGKLIPIAKETAHLADTDAALVPSIWDMVQIEEFSRVDDSKQATRTESITEHVASELAPPENPQQMRYGVETIASGTRFVWWIGTHDASELERAILASVIDSWIDSGAGIGGRTATGHGALALTDRNGDEPWEDWRNEALIANHYAAHAAEVVELLATVN